MACYDSLASLYDMLTRDYDYHQWVSTVLSLYADFHPDNRKDVRVLDLGCGTGRAGVELIERGYEVVGVDASADMLSVAAQKFNDLGASPLLLCQDIHLLNLGSSQFDLAVALCDTFNYITTPAALAAVFKRVATVLSPGGVLVFDINTAHKLATVYGDATFIQEGDDYFIAWENAWHPRKRVCRMHLDIFRAVGNGLWLRNSEEHVQKAHSPAEVSTALAASGFTEIVGPLAAFDLTEPTSETQRVFYAARRSAV